MFRYLKEIIFRDVKSENETKKVSVLLRVNAITMCIYFLCLFVAFSVMGGFLLAFWCAPCLCAFAVALYTTYLNKTRLAVLVSHIVMVCWVIGFIWEFGWDCGAQHFIFVLVVLSFTVCHKSAAWKAGIGTLACILRLLLYVYTNFFEPYNVLGIGSSMVFQVINTVFIFIDIMVILIIFTKDSQEMEQKLIQYNEKLHRLASTDPLTGLLNRRSMQEHLDKAAEDYQKGKRGRHSIAIGDIDFFKKINDTYGHECGDLVLKKIAAVFKENMGKRGEVSRWGGEEFLFVFYNAGGDEALAYLEKLYKKVKGTEIFYKDACIKVTMTFGLGEFDFERGIDYSVNEVDKKLYKGKESGRNRIVYRWNDAAG